MPEQAPTPLPTLIPCQPIPAGAQAFASRMHDLLDGQPKDDATVNRAFEGMDEMFEVIAVRLYSLASMLVGEGEQSVQLVEAAVADAEISPSGSVEESRRNSRVALSRAALAIIARRSAASLAVPPHAAAPAPCIEDEELDAVGVSAAELDRMLSGPDRDRVREWLAQLPTALRTVFALRAVAGLPAAETAALLVAHGGPEALAWTPAAVRETFRQALCSLASQLLHSTTAR
jgi:DNA-directed RNA polymerase specialized sigma24 family protein